MARIFEKSRHPAENIGEKHLACAVLIDTSGSMHGYEKALEDALKELKETIMEDDITRGGVEISVITFDDDVHEVVPFGPIRKMEIPRIDCGGMTCTHAAIQFALDRTSERKEEYKRNGMVYNQPWIWLFTDGQSTDGKPNDPDNGSFAELLRRQNEKKLAFYGVGLGSEVDEKELGGMHKNGMILKATKENLRVAFEFLSASTTAAAHADIDEQLKVAAGKDLDVQFIPIDTI